MTSRELKSRACAIGNRLAATMGRAQAFAKAWAVVKAGAVDMSVHGVSFGRRQEALRRLAQYAPDAVRVFLVSEPENQHDRNAVAVMVGVQGGRGYYKLGYVPAGDTAAAQAVRGKVSVRVLSGDMHGARLRIAV